MKEHGFESGTQMRSNGEYVLWFRRTTKIMNNFCFFDVHLHDGKVLSIESPTLGSDPLRIFSNMH